MAFVGKKRHHNFQDFFNFPPENLVLTFSETVNFDKLAKSRHEAPRWLDKKLDIQGVVFLARI